MEFRNFIIVGIQKIKKKFSKKFKNLAQNSLFNVYLYSIIKKTEQASAWHWGRVAL